MDAVKKSREVRKAQEDFDEVRRSQRCLSFGRLSIEGRGKEGGEAHGERGARKARTAARRRCRQGWESTHAVNLTRDELAAAVILVQDKSTDGSTLAKNGTTD